MSAVAIGYTPKKQQQDEEIVTRNGKQFYYKKVETADSVTETFRPVKPDSVFIGQKPKISYDDVYKLKRDVSDYYSHPVKQLLEYSFVTESQSSSVTEKFINIIDEFDLPPRIKEDYHSRFSFYEELLSTAQEDDTIYEIVVGKVCELEERMQKYLGEAYIHDMLYQFGLFRHATKNQINEANDLGHEVRKYLKALRRTVNK